MHSESKHKRISYLHKCYKFFSDLFRIIWRLSDHEFVLFLIDQHVMCQQVVNNFFDVCVSLGVSDATFFDRVFQIEKLCLLKSFITNVPVFLIHAYKDTFVASLAKDHGNHMFRGIVVAKTGFKVTSANIDNKSLVIVVNLSFTFFVTDLIKLFI